MNNVMMVIILDMMDVINVKMIANLLVYYVMLGNVGYVVKVGF